MQALVSFEQAPPLGAPLRFFLTAPLFAILAGGLLLWSGPGLFASRWTAAALALTHLMTAGFMLQVMLGAMLQLLPVVAGANMARPLLMARLVHATITPGAFFLALAFLAYPTLFFGLAVLFLSLGVLIFVSAAARALYGLPATSPVIRGLKLALGGLGVTVCLGLLLAVVLGWSLDIPTARLVNVHLGWGFVAWGAALVAAVGFVVVPMFQLTPDYPGWFTRAYAYSVLAVVSMWTVAELAGWKSVTPVLATGVVLTVAIFALMTLSLQRRSKRPGRDAVGRLWQVAMLSALAACALWLLARGVPMISEWRGWPLLFGILVLFGGFMSVMLGMLYKIVPFLVWLHLQNAGRGRLVAPNMKKVLAERQIDRQMLAHLCALGLLVLAAFWPRAFVYPAGVALVAANAWLLFNLLSAMKVHRQHMARIAAAGAGGANP